MVLKTCEFEKPYLCNRRYKSKLAKKIHFFPFVRFILLTSHKVKVHSGIDYIARNYTDLLSVKQPS